MEGHDQSSDDTSVDRIEVVALPSGFRLLAPAAHGRVLEAEVDHDWQIEDAAEIMRGALVVVGGMTIDAPIRTRAGCRTVEWRWTGSSLGAFERSADQEAWVPGLSASATALGAQRWVVERYGAEFDPIEEEDLVAVSASIMASGTAVDGVRYPPVGPNSGWILTEPGFSGTVDDLEHHHAYHVAASRPDIERYFGLPPGWRFEWSNDGEAVFRDLGSTAD